MTKIILASNNKGKIKEVKEICKDMQVEIVSMKEAGIDIDIEENGTTFEENALIKAEAVMKLTGELTIADDSGLEVDYLNKEPGVYSARYMGHDTSYDIKNQAIIDRFKCVRSQIDYGIFLCKSGIPNAGQCSRQRYRFRIGTMIKQTVTQTSNAIAEHDFLDLVVLIEYRIMRGIIVGCSRATQQQFAIVIENIVDVFTTLSGC